MAAQMLLMRMLMLLVVWSYVCAAGDTNTVFSPCYDSKVQRGDGFTFALAFSSRDSFYKDRTQLSPCDQRLSLTDKARISVFRPKVDEISLLTINTTASFSPELFGGYMVAFAGRKYAARSVPTFLANTSYIITSTTLVLEFHKGRLVNMLWRRPGCGLCPAHSSPFVCLNNQECALPLSSCKHKGGSRDCSLSIQLAFSGTDKHLSALNSWYEFGNIKQYSLYGAFSNLKNSLTSEFNKFF